jgi:hypothetical protein
LDTDVPFFWAKPYKAMPTSITGHSGSLINTFFHRDGGNRPKPASFAGSLTAPIATVT